MQQACFSSVRTIACMACMICLALASASLLEVVRRGGFSSHLIPAMTGTIGIFPNIYFRRCSPFIDLLRNFHVFEHVACSLVGIRLKIPALWIGLFCPAVWDIVKENIIELFGGHLLWDARSGENIEVVVEFHEPGVKTFERGIAGFMHCMTHSALPLGKGSGQVEIPK